MKMLAIIASAIALALGVYLFAQKEDEAIRSEALPSEDADQTDQRNANGNPVFEWKYEESVTPDGIPSTAISIVAAYPDGVTQTKEVDVIEGSCNAYDNADADVYEKSQMIICYYAGLGRYFKVVQEGSQYLVQRKVFEEASPDYNPPVQAFETVVVF